MAARIRITSAIAAGLILGGCATEHVGPTTATAASTPSSCLETGSRISDNTNCSTYGRSYTNQDMTRTGATLAGDALQRLDPSITVHR